MTTNTGYFGIDNSNNNGCTIIYNADSDAYGNIYTSPAYVSFPNLDITTIFNSLKIILQMIKYIQPSVKDENVLEMIKKLEDLINPNNEEEPKLDELDELCRIKKWNV